MNQFDTLRGSRPGVRSKDGVRAPQSGAMRALDVVLAWTALILLSPVFVLIAVLIWLEDRDPVILRQRRTGPNGRTFQSYRFRTIRVIARGAHAKQPIHGASRVTRLGFILRTFRLDELPQLWNVIRGEMSLMGPRPRGLPQDKA